MAGRESSLEPILLGEWIATPVLYCIFGSSLVVLCHTCVLYCGISFKNITQIGQIYLALDAELYHLLLQWL